MSKYKAAPLSGQIVQEATTWFVEFNEGEVGQPDREAFIEWLKASPEHIRAYLQVTAHWEEAGALSKASAPSITDLVLLARGAGNVIPIGGGRSAEDAQSGASTEGFPDDSRAVSVRTHRLPRYLVAASVAIAMIAASGLSWFEHERGTYATDIGEQRSIRLGDGSTVDLNAHSKIRVALREHERDVELIEGQALFRVAKDHSRPFIVHSGDTNVMAVGTQFDVNRHRGDTTITVVEGRVGIFSSTQPTGGGPEVGSSRDETPSSTAVPLTRPTPAAKSATPGSGPEVLNGSLQSKEEGTAKREIFLDAGEQLTVSGSSVRMAPNADVIAATAWTQRQIIFSSMALSDVVEEFNRYNTRQLIITDPRIENTQISGEFSSTNPDSLLKGLEALNKFRIRETPSRIEISAK